MGDWYDTQGWLTINYTTGRVNICRLCEYNVEIESIFIYTFHDFILISLIQILYPFLLHSLPLTLDNHFSLILSFTPLHSFVLFSLILTFLLSIFHSLSLTFSCLYFLLLILCLSHFPYFILSISPCNIHLSILFLHSFCLFLSLSKTHCFQFGTTSSHSCMTHDK